MRLYFKLEAVYNMEYGRKDEQIFHRVMEMIRSVMVERSWLPLPEDTAGIHHWKPTAAPGGHLAAKVRVLVTNFKHEFHMAVRLLYTWQFNCPKTTETQQNLPGYWIAYWMLSTPPKSNLHRWKENKKVPNSHQIVRSIYSIFQSIYYKYTMYYWEIQFFS